MIEGVSIVGWSVPVPSWTWVSVGSITHLVLFVAVILHCLKHRKEATSTILWIFIAWSFPIIGPLLFLAYGINRVPAKGRLKEQSNRRFFQERRLRENPSMPLAHCRDARTALAGKPLPSSASRLNRLMDAVLFECPPLGGNRIMPLVTGDEAFPRMLSAIENATHHIHIQTFILGNDATGRQFLETLRKKAESGVTVRLLFDRFGSSHAWFGGLISRYTRIPNMRVVGWTQANPLKRQFQINLRNHRKLLVVDGKKAFMGGLNLQVENTTRPRQPPIRDYHFEIDGPLVSELQYAFFRDWYFMTGEDPDRLLHEKHFPSVAPVGNTLARVINAGPSSETEVLTDTFFAVIGSAERELLAVTPYFVPPPEILRAFRVAALRGVDVRLVLPRKNNHRYAGLAGRALYDDLLAAGVRLFECPPPFIHAKALIVDDELAIMGTANLDVRSLRLNYETNIAVFGEEFSSKLKRIVLNDLGASRELKLDQWRSRPAVHRMLENACNLLTPIL